MSRLPPELRLTRLANAYQLSRAVQVAARLGLGRLLRDGEHSVSSLARHTGTDEAVLRRLLRFLADLEVVTENADGTFSPTEYSDHLFLVDNIAQGEEAWAAWGGLGEALASGVPSFPQVHGMPFYEYAARHPERRAAWISWNRFLSRPIGEAVAAALDLEGRQTIVDVGGGDGALLAEILCRHPDCRGILFDLPEVVENALEKLREAGVEERCEVVGGDIRRGVPPGGDLYILCRVLLNCDSEGASCYLTSCREAMTEESRLLVIEGLMPEPDEPRSPSLAASDLHLFLLWGGGHRTVDEMDSLLRRADLQLIGVGDIADVGSDMQLLEAQCAEPPESFSEVPDGTRVSVSADDCV